MISVDLFQWGLFRGKISYVQLSWKKIQFDSTENRQGFDLKAEGRRTLLQIICQRLSAIPNRRQTDRQTDIFNIIEVLKG